MQDYMTFDDLLHFCEFLIAFATFICLIFYSNHKKK